MNEKVGYETVSEFLKENYEFGQKVYPENLCEALKLDLYDAYSVMEKCCDAGIAEQNLQIFCPYCGKYIGDSYKSLSDIPKSLRCEYCNGEISRPEEDAYVMYKML